MLLCFSEKTTWLLIHQCAVPLYLGKFDVMFFLTRQTKQLCEDN